MLNNKIAVVGGINYDICGASAGELLERESNPGGVSFRPGGVGRNIAHNLSLMGQKVSLLCAIGKDSVGEQLIDSCHEAGIDISMARILPGERSSVYLYISDNKGEMRVAVNEMGITERLDEAFITTRLSFLNSRDAVVLDANLPKATIDYIASACTAPLYADPVSAVKAPRLKDVLPKLCALKPNLHEGAALTGEQEPEKIVEALLSMGVKRVFLSMGEDGLLAAQQGEKCYIPNKKVAVVNDNGAGDAAAATIVICDLEHRNLKESAELALQAAALTCQSESTNTEKLRELI